MWCLFEKSQRNRYKFRDKGVRSKGREEVGGLITAFSSKEAISFLFIEVLYLNVTTCV